MLRSRLCEGSVRHRRFEPVEHQFSYGLQMFLLDLEEIPQVAASSRLFSMERRNLIEFRRRDYIGGGDQNIRKSIVDLIARESGEQFDGSIRLLTNLRYWGCLFNPVSFYLCYSASNDALQYIVAEITNTPWKERHAYLLRPEKALRGSGKLRFEFDKVFHVSPFMPMDMRYRWSFSFGPERMAIHMDCYKHGNLAFDATLNLRQQAVQPGAVRRLALSFPGTCAKVIAAIYWQALRLWLKRVPFHTHPKWQPAKARHYADCD